ncbi:MAG TPA: glucarate dehydratase family protein [Acidimicrobiales bacterium]|nr:glucarate dehydratase family protein [Acidimicrobiales bacterium]
MTEVTITPVAFRDPPLLNAVGVHEPFALRSIVQVHTYEGVTGLGESYGDAGHLDRLRRVGEALVGIDPFATHEMLDVTRRTLSGVVGTDGHGLTGSISASGTVLRTFAAFEVAALDIQGKLLDRPVSDLLGGAVRATVPFSAYLFYKWAAHPGQEPDSYGEALDPEGILVQATWMRDTYGFRSIKLKGGVFEPAAEIEAIVELGKAFGDTPLRLDPNTAWSVETSIEVGAALGGVLEYLEDPTPGLKGMSKVAREVPMPLATNMCVVGFDDIPEALRRRSVGVILSDHHYWGGLHKVHDLASICDTFGLGLSMHSNSHLGISLAAMTHVAAATPNLTYALDTHWPWKSEDVVTNRFTFVDGSLEVSREPGLGVELDPDALAHLHEQYLNCGLTERNDTRYMQAIEPSFRAELPRW